MEIMILKPPRRAQGAWMEGAGKPGSTLMLPAPDKVPGGPGTPLSALNNSQKSNSETSFSEQGVGGLDAKITSRKFKLY